MPPPLLPPYRASLVSSKIKASCFAVGVTRMYFDHGMDSGMVTASSPRQPLRASWAPSTVSWGSSARLRYVGTMLGLFHFFSRVATLFFREPIGPSLLPDFQDGQPHLYLG